MAIGQGQGGRSAGIQPHVPQVDRRERVCRAFGPVERAGDNPRAAAVEGDFGDYVARDRLIPRRRQLVLRRQVDPQLHHAERPARL